MKAKLFLPFYDFKHNLKSSIVIYLVVTLSVILCVTSLITLKSFIIYRESLNEISDNIYDLIFLDTKYEDYLELIKYKDDNIDDIFYAHNIGYAKLNKNHINNKNYILIEELIPDGLANEKFNLLGGRIPISDEEILIPLEYASIYDIKIGDTVFYDIGDIISQNGDYYRFKSYDESFEKYKFKQRINKTYTVVGIYNKSNSFYVNNTDLSHYYAYTYMDERILNNDDLVDVLISLRDKNRLSKDLENYKLFLKPTENSLITIAKDNNNYGSTYKNQSYSIIGLLLLIIITLAIKSSFNYESKKRKDFYSQELCLGATTKNIKDSWYYLTYFISIIGIISGVYFSNLLLHYFLKIFVNTAKIDIVLVEMFSKGIILYSVLIVLIAIIISYVLSEKKILYVTAFDYLKNKFEPIDPRYVHYDEYTQLKGEISKYIKSNFALNHIKDNKLMFSLPFFVAFLIIFISFNTIIAKPVVDYINSKDINLTVNISDFESHLDSLNNISRIDGVKDSLIQGSINEILYLKSDDQINDRYSFLKTDGENIIYPINIIVIENNKYDSLVKKDSDIVLIPTFNILKNNDIVSSRIFESEEHKRIELYGLMDTYELDNVLVSDIDSELLTIRNGFINLLVKESVFNTLFNGLSVKYNTIALFINDHIFIDRLNQYASNNKINIDIVYNVESLIYNPNTNYIILSYYLSLLICMLSIILFCIIVFTSLNVYVKERVKELALLRTIGISSKNINQIINGEYGDAYFVALLIGVIIGAVFNKVLCEVYIINRLSNVEAAMTQLIYYLVLFMVLIIVFSISLLISTRKIKKKSPIIFLKGYYREF